MLIIRRWFWCTIVTIYALPMLAFCLFLDGTPRDWVEMMGEQYRSAWAGEEP